MVKYYLIVYNKDNWQCVNGELGTSFFGSILSGEKLIDNNSYKNLLFKQFPNAIGGEMEGYGIYSACANQNLSEWIIIKGICDWADGNKNKNKDENQRIAVESAVSFCKSVFSESVFSELYGKNQQIQFKKTNISFEPQFKEYIERSLYEYQTIGVEGKGVRIYTPQILSIMLNSKNSNLLRALNILTHYDRKTQYGKYLLQKYENYTQILLERSEYYDDEFDFFHGIEYNSVIRDAHNKCIENGDEVITEKYLSFALLNFMQSNTIKDLYKRFGKVCMDEIKQNILDRKTL